MLSSLETFLEAWDKNFEKEQSSIPLFDGSKPLLLSKKQQIFFVKVFYHVRGHFHEVLWLLGNIAPDVTSKQRIIKNISEEFGGKKLSHEKLYFRFTKNLGVNLVDEIITEEHYLPFVKHYNKGLIEWLIDKDWHSCLAAFAAYERLDNLDYSALLSLASTFNVPKDSLGFFVVHCHAQHFEEVKDSLYPIWQKNPDKVMRAFNFIAKHQLEMWKQLSDVILNDSPLESLDFEQKLQNVINKSNF